MTNTAHVKDWYDINAEGEHSRALHCRLEFAISLRIILQCLDQMLSDNSGPKHILDLGGATGRYAVELAKKGHHVTLVDISPSELEIAASYAQESDVHLANIIQADALNIRDYPSIFKESHYDMILCQGPLYHLLEERERLDVLTACATMCKINGYVLAAFVTKFAHLRDLVQRNANRLLNENCFYKTYMITGQYTRNPKTLSHHIYPADVSKLILKLQNQPLRLERLVACESFMGGLSTSLKDVNDEVFEAWVDIALNAAEDPAVLGSGDHLLAVARRV